MSEIKITKNLRSYESIKIEYDGTIFNLNDGYTDCRGKFHSNRKSEVIRILRKQVPNYYKLVMECPYTKVTTKDSIQTFQDYIHYYEMAEIIESIILDEFNLCDFFMEISNRRCNYTDSIVLEYSYETYGYRMNSIITIDKLTFNGDVFNYFLTELKSRISKETDYFLKATSVVKYIESRLKELSIDSEYYVTMDSVCVEISKDINTLITIYLNKDYSIPLIENELSKLIK